MRKQKVQRKSKPSKKRGSFSKSVFAEIRSLAGKGKGREVFLQTLRSFKSEVVTLLPKEILDSSTYFSKIGKKIERFFIRQGRTRAPRKRQMSQAEVKLGSAGI